MPGRERWRSFLFLGVRRRACGEAGRALDCVDGEEVRGTHIGGLEGSLEDCDRVVLGCDIAEVLGATFGK